MSKTLFLIRHAKSSWSNATLNDKNRPLNDRGERDAPKMGLWLNDYCKEQNIDVLDLLVSTSVRTQMTAKLLRQKLSGVDIRQFDDDDIYLASAELMLRLIRQFDDLSDNLALIGHNPGMHDLYEELSSEMLDNFPTSAIAALQFDTDYWFSVSRQSLIDVDFISPKQLAR